jgi:ankyrin repeat protein
VKLLLENGADHTLVDDAGLTALYRAAQSGHVDCVRLLIDAGADIRKADNVCGNTPLIESVICKHLECARLLVPVSDLDHYSRQGFTAFHASVVTASKECFELLLPLVDVDVRTRAGVEADGSPVAASVGRTSLQIACSKGLFEFVKALLRAGADPLAKNNVFSTPLHFASQFGHLACVTHLLGRPDNRKMTPAEVDTVNVQGCTSLRLAASLGHERVCAALLEAGASLMAIHPDYVWPHAADARAARAPHQSFAAGIALRRPSIRRAPSATTAARRPSRLAFAA